MRRELSYKKKKKKTSYVPKSTASLRVRVCADGEKYEILDTLLDTHLY